MSKQFNPIIIFFHMFSFLDVSSDLDWDFFVR